MHDKKTLTVLAAVAALLILATVALNRAPRIEIGEPIGPNSGRLATEGEAAFLFSRAATLPPASDGRSEKERLLALCTLEQVTELGSEIYSSASLLEVLPDGKEILEIIVLSTSGSLYIRYAAKNDDQVTLVYTDDGLSEVAVYRPMFQRVYHWMQGEARVLNGF